MNGAAADRLSNLVDVRQLEGPLVLGNSSLTDDPWEGDVLWIAVYGDVLTSDQIFSDSRKPDPARESPFAVYYVFAERSDDIAYGHSNKHIPLYIPNKLILLDGSLLSWDLHTDWSGIRDVLINIFGFVPFGFFGTATLLSWTSLKRSMWYTLAVGFLLSLLIETTQSYLPFRSSSLTDLVMNTFGTLSGVGLFAGLDCAKVHGQTLAPVGTSADD